jgi:hypothetical protein
VPREGNGRDFVSVRLHRECDAGNAAAALFGNTLALHSIEFWTVRIVARLAIEIRKFESGDGAQFGSGERKKGNVDFENEIFGVAVPCADNTSSVLVCDGGVGKRAKWFVSSRHKYLRSRLNPSQVSL